MIQNFQDEVCFVLDTMKGKSKPVFSKYWQIEPTCLCFQGTSDL